MLGAQADAQIIYTDLDPDIFRDDSYFPYLLNIDEPATGVDFVFAVNYWYYSVFGTNVILAAPWFLEAENGIAGVPYTYGGFFNVGLNYQLEEGALIGSGMGFVDNNFIETSYYTPQAFLAVQPMFAGQPNFWSDDGEPHFIGVKFIKDDQLHYGWVRLSIDPGYSAIHIYDHAYNSVPDAPILAGDMGGCAEPEIVGSGAITAASAKVKWSAAPDADIYEINFRAVGATDWLVAPVDAPKVFRKLSGLDCNTTYEWKVRSVCTDGTPSMFSSTATFTTAACRTDGTSNDPLFVYAYGKTIHIDLPVDADASIRIFDLQGAEVFAQANLQGTQVIRTELPNGLYLVQAILDDQQQVFNVALTDQ